MTLDEEFGAIRTGVLRWQARRGWSQDLGERTRQDLVNPCEELEVCDVKTCTGATGDCVLCC